MNKLLEKQQTTEYAQHFQDSFINNTSYYEPSYNAYQQNNNMYSSEYAGNQENGQPYANCYYNMQYTQQPQQYYNNMPNKEYQNVSQNYYNQEQNSFVRPTQQYNIVQAPVSNEKKNKKKSKLNTKAKLLIGVYFFIVAVIATLLLVNMAFGSTTVSADGDEFISINEEALNSFVTADGHEIQLSDEDSIVDYNYDVQENWFDTMCDNITNKAGK